MNWDNLIKVMKNGENNTTKFFGKSVYSDDIGSTIVAMANTKGGSIYIGIDINNYHLYGVNQSVETIQTQINSHCRPPLRIITDNIEKNGKKIVVINIQDTADKPYYYKNICYIMDGKTPRVALVEKNHMPIVEKQGNTLKVVNDTTSVQTALNITNNAKEEREDNPIIIEKEINQEPQDQKEKNTIESTIESAPKILNQRQTEALEYLELEKKIKNRDYRDLFNVSHKTAHLELVDMVDKGLITSSGQGRNTHYVIESSNQEKIETASVINN